MGRVGGQSVALVITSYAPFCHVAGYLIYHLPAPISCIPVCSLVQSIQDMTTLSLKQDFIASRKFM
jgi:hypothetical protein